METLEVLKSARELLSDSKRWTRGWYARDKYGHRKMWNSDNAVRYCSMGAVHKVAGNRHPNAIMYLNRIINPLHPDDIIVVGYNDNHTHKDILEMFDKAIDLCEKENKK